MIRHTVMFRLRRPVEEDARARLLDGLRAFSAAAPLASGPGRVSGDLGVRGENPRGCDALVEVEFPDAQALQGYLAHPLHLALLHDVLEPTCEGWWSVQTEA